MHWLSKRIGLINGLAIAVNLWLAADNFSKGGWWYVLSAFQMVLVLFVLHTYLNYRARLRVLRAEHDALLHAIAQLERAQR